MHEPVEPTLNERGDEIHPAYGMIAANRVQSTPGAVLFDSDIKHQHSVVIRIATASRKRDLNRDWLHGRKEFVEVQMSEAQWASFVSSMNSTGVPCTIRRREDDYDIPGIRFAPRLEESVNEVRQAADKAIAGVQEAFKVYSEKKNAANLRNLESAIGNMPANAKFAAQSLSEHAENVVQKARADIEAMVLAKAEQVGLDPIHVKELGAGDE